MSRRTASILLRAFNDIMAKELPNSILIVGCGVFGLSTAYSLAENPDFASASVTVIDLAASEASFPSPDGASIDSSRVIRADYADPITSALAAEAQPKWREQADDQLGGQGRYSESGFVLMADDKKSTAQVGSKSGMDYVMESWGNVKTLSEKGRQGEGKMGVLEGAEALRDALGVDGHPGDWGYFNGLSGWADAQGSMRWLHKKASETGRITFVDAQVQELVTEGKKVTGVMLTGGNVMKGDIVVVAAGAWTGGLIDLRGRVEATGHALGYIDITDEEAAVMREQPVALNLTNGLFVIPPRGNELKVARHAFGYLNPQRITRALPRSPSHKREEFVTSLPWTSRDGAGDSLPHEAEVDLRRALRTLVPLPGIESRPWKMTRLCWYSDTPNGDWLVDWHPGWENLFIATGDSGHGFKFLPVLGDRVVGCLLGKGGRLGEKWAWKETVDENVGKEINGVYKGLITEDGSRGSEPGMILRDEFGKRDGPMPPRKAHLGMSS